METAEFRYSCLIQYSVVEEDPFPLIISAFPALLLLSAFFSASEVAFISLSPAKIRSLNKDAPGRLTQLVVRLSQKPERLLTTILIGNNVVNIFMASLATVVATRLFGDAGIGLATGAVTLGVLVFGEIFPKGIAQRHAVAFCRYSAIPLSALSFVLTPFTVVFEKLFHFFGGQRKLGISEEELKAAVDLGTESGEIKEHERELIQNVLAFTDTRVGAIATPRVDIIAIEKNSPLTEAKALFHKENVSRMPVFAGSLDNVVGVLTLRQVFRAEDSVRTVGELLLKEIVLTPSSRPIRSLLSEFLSRHRHMAVVIDEHGGTSGLITMEDILEELVGEIEDEEDVREQEMQKVNSKVVIAPASTTLLDIDEALGTQLHLEEGCEEENIAFLVLEKLGRLAKTNDRLRAGGAEITVEEATRTKIISVKIEALD